MKPIKTFRIGSNAFFKRYHDFYPKDVDELCIMDNFIFPKTNVIHINKMHGKDVFFFRNMTKEEFIEETKKTKLPMTAGKFLVPSFAKHLGMTIEDLKELEFLFNSMDEAHAYEKVIYDAYIENGDFRLTDEQRDAAYEKYKESHTAKAMSGNNKPEEIQQNNIDKNN